MTNLRRPGHHSRRRSTDLTESERHILRLYASGLNRSQIGTRLGLSHRTIGNSLTIAKEKLGADTLVQAAVLAATEQRATT